MRCARAARRGATGVKVLSKSEIKPAWRKSKLSDPTDAIPSGMCSALPRLAPGELRRGVDWTAAGTLLFVLPVTKSVTVFGLTDDDTDVVDVIVRVKDGWTEEVLSTLTSALRNAEAAHVKLSGFPERLPVEQGGSMCLHLTWLELRGCAWFADTERALPDAPRPLSTNPKRNSSRFPAFADFLLHTFLDHAALSSGSGVVDVAGGSGGLAFELSVRRQVPCVVVDPRKLRLTGTQQIVLAHRRGVCEALEPWRQASPLAQSMHQTFQARPVTQLEEYFDSRAVLAGESAALAAAVESCSALVGMHPDQALDAIVSVGLALRKPFAVVPCCVFWKHGRNVNRRTPEGDVVKTYEQLCDFIASRDPAIREARLPFHGLNRVFFWIPEAAAHIGAPTDTYLGVPSGSASHCQPCDEACSRFEARVD